VCPGGTGVPKHVRKAGGDYRGYRRNLCWMNAEGSKGVAERLSVLSWSISVVSWSIAEVDYVGKPNRKMELTSLSNGNPVDKIDNRIRVLRDLQLKI
jgi:hypothetical protein